MNSHYVMLYNFETKNDQKKAKEFLNILPKAKILNYGLVGTKENREKDEKLISLWIKQEYFLAAWSYFNHKDLRNQIVNFQDGIDYLQIQLSDVDFQKEII